ncbi:MAG: pyruvate ferredoxin oxidoreductase [archaeon]
MKKTIKPLTGNGAAAEAMRQINPDVVSAYPMTPASPIVEAFAEFVADGKVDTEMLLAESEHTAMSGCVGAAAAGARAMTASASQGVAYMYEVLPVASGLRLPILMHVGNRALNSPINIHCDTTDSMVCRDLGWLQLYNENPQEAYEGTLLGLRLAEHKDVLLPIMICQDGFITSHNMVAVEIFDDAEIKKYVGEWNAPFPLFDLEKRWCVGPMKLKEYCYENKRQQTLAMENALKVYPKLASELTKITGHEHPLFESYMLDDAEAAIVVLNSTAGMTKDVIDEYRAKGKKVGLLKPRLYRPFPYKEIVEALKPIQNVAVLDRSEAYGAYPPIYTDIRAALANESDKPNLQSYIFGIGGRDIFKTEIRKVFDDMLKGSVDDNLRFIGVR